MTIIREHVSIRTPAVGHTAERLVRSNVAVEASRLLLNRVHADLRTSKAAIAVSLGQIQSSRTLLVEVNTMLAKATTEFVTATASRSSITSVSRQD